MKKSFLIHIDSLDVIDDLTDEQCGELLRSFRAHHINEEIEVSQIVKIAFSPFKNQFNRDLEKYKETCYRNKTNGLKGGRPKNPKNPSGLSKNRTKPKKPDNDSDSDSDKDNDNDKDNKKDKYVYQNIGGLNIPAFEKYLSYRKDASIKKLTKQGEVLAAKKLVSFGNQIEVVNQSIANGWAGLFELKNQIKNSDDDFNALLAESNVIEGEFNVGE